MDILAIVLGVMSLSFLLAYIHTVKKLASVSSGLANLYLNYTALIETKIAKPTDENTVDDIHKENFIKFLSDSREWAYAYIEDVQKGLEKFISEVEPHIEYYDEYGIVIEGMIPPHDKALKVISKEFKDLKKLLPEEVND